MKVKLTSVQADLLLVVVAFCWGSGYIVVKTSIDEITPLVLLVLKMTITSICALALFRKKLKEATKEDLKAGTIMGVFLTIGFVLQTYGLKYTTAGNSAFLTATDVIMVPYICWMVTKKKPGRNNLAAAFLMLFGIFLLTFNFNNAVHFNIGDGLTLLCAIGYAAHIVVSDTYTESKDPFTLATIQFLVATLIIYIMFIFHPSKIIVPKETIGSVLYLGIISTFLCFGLQTFAQKYTPAVHTVIILTLESLFGSALGIMILKERYTPWMLVGAAIILVSILATELGFEGLLIWKKNRLIEGDK